MEHRQEPLDYLGPTNTDVIVEKIYIKLFEQFPNLYTINFVIDLENILRRLKKKYELQDEDFIIKTEEACRDRWTKVNYYGSTYLIRLPDKILLNISSTKAEIYYSAQTDWKNVKELISLFKTRKKKKNVERRNFYLLKSEIEDFSLRKIEAKKVDLDLKLFYNDDFLPFHERISTFLQDSDARGVVLIHGKQGTGKTTYLKHLIFNTDHQFILVPRSLFAQLDSTNLFFYLRDFRDYILILDYCDPLLSGTGRHNPLAGFLRNAEGLMGNDFVYKIICTATLSSHQINYNYLRKAKKIYRYEMKELPVEKAGLIRQKLGIEGNIHRPMVLEEIIRPLSDFRENKLGFKN